MTAVRSVCAGRMNIYRAEFTQVLKRIGIPAEIAGRDDVFARCVIVPCWVSLTALTHEVVFCNTDPLMDCVQYSRHAGWCHTITN